MAVDRETASFERARETMVDRQVRPSDVTRFDIIDAMLWAPRERFVPKSKRAQAYVGEQLQIAPGRYELEPRVFAKMLEAAAPQPGDLALVIGAGYGYSAAVLSRLVEAVVALEPVAEMRQAAAKTLSELDVDNVAMSDGALERGRPEHQPYNLIFVNGGIEIPPPAALLGQLVEGGQLVAVHSEGPLGRCRVWVRGDAVGVRTMFDANAPILPGFEKAEGFVF